MKSPITSVERAIALMREAQVELDSAGFAAAAAHLETALGFAEAEVSDHDNLAVAQGS